VPVSLALLLIVFGALVAAGIPLLLTGTAVISAISLLAIPSRWLPVGGITSSIVLLVGMAVGIDYSLFYLRRVREERAAGRTTREALRIAAATSGRAIVVSGLTVMISLAGLFLTGIDVFSGFAVGTILVVGVAVLGSLTFLPALLSLLGKGTDRARIPFLGRRQAAARRSRLWQPVVPVLVVSVPIAGGGTDTTSDTPRLTAANHDLDSQLGARTPLVFCFILGLAFLLLMAAFRSVAIPAVSICLNLLSVGAAFGVMTWVFQDGHLEGPLGFTAYGGITSWLPLFMFVLLFGLSMDYHVFILSRIRELRLRGASAREAIADGIASSAGVVTSAAAIMVAVFSIFATLSIIEFKVFGVAMAAAVLIDATIVRGVLLPAALALLGERAWWPGGRSSRDRGRHGVSDRGWAGATIRSGQAKTAPGRR
jgi:uncharacterized membrane protein YdfJ with MMPL/SSD domain